MADPTLASLRAQMKAALMALWELSKEAESAWKGARAAHGSIPFASRAEYLRRLERDLAPYLEIPGMIKKAKAKHHRLRAGPGTKHD